MSRRLHMIVGLLGLAVFVFTGGYMRASYDMEAVDPGLRLLLRSRHIDILLCSLVNLVLAAYYHPVQQG